MITDYERKIIKCDVCGRQIVKDNRVNKYVTGPLSNTVAIGVNLHCCEQCWPEYKEWEEYEQARQGY